MKKTIFFLTFTIFSASAFAQVKESTKLKKDSAGNVVRVRTIIVEERVPDTLVILFQIKQIDVEMDTLKSRRKRLVQELKDWKKAKDGPPGSNPNSAPRSEDTTPNTPISVPNPDANKPPTKPKKKNR
jgi:hypothetical protein